MYDFIIIGAGFGGLSTAALLAKKGKKVLLLEASSFPGGRAFYHEKEGFVWQYGQHSHRLGEGGFAAEVMRRLGQKLEFYRAPKGKSKIFYRGRLYDRPEGPLDSSLQKRSPLRLACASFDFTYFFSALTPMPSTI